MGLNFPAVMGILNVTPDSFSDGGRYVAVPAAVQRAMEMIAEGAAIIDVGGESTRPGAEPVTVDEELRRVIPVISRLRSESDTPISVDTSTPQVMRAAAAAGATMINDIRALGRPGALMAAAETGLPVVLMHMKGEPRTMQDAPHYDDLMAELLAFFAERIARCTAAGISAQIFLDPGFGFGKTPVHNLTVINRLDVLAQLGRPIVVGLSRKSTVARVLEGVSEDRMFGSIGGAVMAVVRGASVVRTHDVGPTVQALRMTTAIMNEHPGSGVA